MKRLLTCLAVVCTLSPALSFAGIEWTTSIKTTGKGKKANNEIDVHSYAQGGNVKQVFEGVSNEDMFYFKDGYWLYKSGEDNIYIVNEKEQNYTVISIDGLLQVTGQLGQLAKIEILDHSIKVEKLPNEELLGYSCDHLKVTTDYTMKIKIAFIKKTMKIHEEKEIYSTPEIQELDQIGPGFQSKEYRTGIPDLDEMIQKEIEHSKKIGFPLKVITKTNQMNKKGKPTGDTSSTMTVNKVLFTTFPDGFFDIPGEFDREAGSWEAFELN